MPCSPFWTNKANRLEAVHPTTGIPMPQMHNDVLKYFIELKIRRRKKGNDDSNNNKTEREWEREREIYEEQQINDNYGVFENDLRKLYLVVNDIQFIHWFCSRC